MTEILQTIPLVRIFDEARAKAFYCGWLGFTIDWEHRFEENMPIYFQISLGRLSLHLSEHHGDCTPGSKVFVRCTGLRDWHTSLLAKVYKYNRPELENAFWGGISMTVIDPFHNQLLFHEAETSIDKA